MAIRFIRENVNQPIRSLTNVSYPMADTQGGLCNRLTGTIHVDSSDILGFEPSDEYIAMPPGKTVAGVYHQARRGNGRHPNHLWIHHAGFRDVV